MWSSGVRDQSKVKWCLHSGPVGLFWLFYSELNLCLSASQHVRSMLGVEQGVECLIKILTLFNDRWVFLAMRRKCSVLSIKSTVIQNDRGTFLLNINPPLSQSLCLWFGADACSYIELTVQDAPIFRDSQAKLESAFFLLKCISKSSLTVCQARMERFLFMPTSKKDIFCVSKRETVWRLREIDAKNSVVTECKQGFLWSFGL